MKQFCIQLDILLLIKVLNSYYFRRPYHVVSPRLYPDRSGKIEEFELDTSFPLEELTKFNLMWGYSIRITFAKRHQVCCYMYESSADEFENFRLPGLHTRTKSLDDFGEETSSSFYQYKNFSLLVVFSFYFMFKINFYSCISSMYLYFQIYLLIKI